MTRRLTFGLCLAVALGTLGCQDPPAAPTSTTTTQSELRKHPTAGRDLPGRGALTLPRSARITDQYLTDLARLAIDPDDYVCPASTPVVFGRAVGCWVWVTGPPRYGGGGSA